MTPSVLSRTCLHACCSVVPAQVREWYLGGAARCYRQTIMLSSFATADMNAAVQRFCSSHAGRLRLKLEHEGVLAQVVPQVGLLAAVPYMPRSESGAVHAVAAPLYTIAATLQRCGAQATCSSIAQQHCSAHAVVSCAVQQGRDMK